MDPTESARELEREDGASGVDGHTVGNGAIGLERYREVAIGEPSSLARLIRSSSSSQDTAPLTACVFPNGSVWIMQPIERDTLIHSLDMILTFD